MNITWKYEPEFHVVLWLYPRPESILELSLMKIVSTLQPLRVQVLLHTCMQGETYTSTQQRSLTNR